MESLAYKTEKGLTRSLFQTKFPFNQLHVSNTYLQKRNKSLQLWCGIKHNRIILLLICFILGLEYTWAQTAINYKFNFQDQYTTPPSGYTKDYGLPYGTKSGTSLVFGWVTQASLSTANHMAVDMTAGGRNRNRTGISVLQNTIIHMQYGDINIGGQYGAWEINVPNGLYTVSVGVGDMKGSTTYDSQHKINVEGAMLIDRFQGSPYLEYAQNTGQYEVKDGKLTIDAIGGYNTKINFASIASASSPQPFLVSTNPANGALNVSINASISSDIMKLPNGGIDNATLTTNNVRLIEVGTNTVVPASVNGSGGRDVVNLTPSVTLKPNTAYRFEVTANVKDLTGASFIPYSSVFMTGDGATGPSLANVKFNKVGLSNTTGDRYATLTIGPDGMLYALTIDGYIKRFNINANGTLGTPLVIATIRNYSGGSARLAVGLAFAPNATATNLVAYVTHGTYLFEKAPDWDNKLTRLTGSSLQNAQDVLIHLPRSYKDHLCNSLAFGPDGALYFPVGSNSAMGEADTTWGGRPERLLSGSLVRLDLTKLPTTLPLSVKTAEGGGSYNPYASNAPLTMYATGVRNAYDLVWHSNGQLYVPTNGSAAGGNTPKSVSGTLRPDGTTYNGPSIPGLNYVTQTMNDYLFKVVKGGYYGHPNPRRGEYVLNGGNPTTGTDPAETKPYPVGVQPDANWRGFAYDFKNNKSPNGAIEYKSNKFGGVLKGKLLVVRYSQNDDIIVLEPGGTNLDIINATEGFSVPGLSGFIDPLDLVEDTRNGNIYVSEYGANKITLLVPADSTTNQAPVVSAGGNKSLTLPTNSITLTGSASDPDGTIATTLWTKQSGPSATMSGTNTTNLALSNLVAGTYVFRLTATDNMGASSFNEATLTVQGTSSEQLVTSLTLINANTDQAIVTLTNGYTINYATLGTQNLSIRANTSPSVVGSVRFNLDNGLVVKNENTAPYAFFGDNGNTSTTDYYPIYPALSLGSHTLTVTPYSLANGGGTAGTPLTLTFTVSNSTTQTGNVVTSLSLINTNTDKEIATLTNGYKIDYATLGTQNISIRANTSPTTVGSVLFDLDNGLVKKTENMVPYAFFGDNVNVTTTDYYPINPALQIGSHTITATPYSSTNGGGTKGQALTIGFTVANSTLNTGARMAAATDSVSTTLTLGTSPNLDAPVLKAFPNPFSESLTILCGFVKAEHAVVEVFDANGRLIEKLWDAPVSAGQALKLIFNGQPLPSGIYHCRLRTGSYTQHQKLLLAK